MTHKYARPGTDGPLVVKYGGHAIYPDRASSDPLLDELSRLHAQGRGVVLVHGGGPEIDAALAGRGVVTQRVDGLRVTDAGSLAVIETVLAATINKRLVRACQALGMRAAGIAGGDGPTLIARKARGSNGVDLGYVGAIDRVDPRLLQTLLAHGFLPVVAPLAVAHDYAHAYNVNADLAAAAIAAALGARAFVIVTNVSRVLRNPDDPGSGIDRLSLREAASFAATDACRASMRPKLEAAIAAVTGGAIASYICAPSANAIRSALRGNATIVEAAHAGADARA
jgi:acetylglutamate kinase